MIAAAIVGLLLRLYRFDAQSLWVDEAATFLSSVGSIERVISQTDVPGFIPPLYFLVVNAVLRLGDGEAVLRLPSVIFGAACIPLLYVVARYWVRDSVAALAAVLLAASPFHVWYSQEARAYALLLFLALTALWGLQSALGRANAGAARTVFVVSAAAAFYCHTLALALIALAAGIVAIREPWRAWPRWIAAFAAIGLLILPAFLRYFTLGGQSPEEWPNPVGLGNIGFMLWAFSTGYSLGPSVAELHEPEPLRTALASAHLIAPILLLVTALLLVGSLAVWRRSRTALASIALLVMVPIAFSVLGAVVMHYTFNVRYVTIAFPGFVVLLASGILAFRSPPARWLSGAAILLVDAVALGNYYFDPRYAREDNRGASAFIQRVGSLDSDLVVVSAPYTSLALDYYLRRSPRLVAPVPGEPPRGKPMAVESEAARLLEGRDRFWLFLSRTYHSDPENSLRRFADAHFDRDTAFVGVGVEAIRYVRRDAAPVDDRD